jgi:transposase InsO family protein
VLLKADINYVTILGQKYWHSTTNGKIEKWFDSYRRFRYEIESLDDFILWYNDRPHGSLDFENLESPNLAFWRRLPQESIFGIGIRVFGW